MAVNEEFCVAWANAQVEAGASAIVYFDPVSSPMIVPRETYLRTGHAVARRTIPRDQGPDRHPSRLRPGPPDHRRRCLDRNGDCRRDRDWKTCGGDESRLPGQIDRDRKSQRHRDAPLDGSGCRARSGKKPIAAAGSGGGFILSDNHGEIPYQVPEQTLEAIAAAVDRWGRYPLEKNT